jgi:hypothetical protein
MASRLDRGSCQFAAEIGLVELADPQASRHGIAAEPPEGKLIGCHQHDEGV